MTEEKINLSSSELASLWTSYMQNTMSVQFLSYLQATVEDKAISQLVQTACQISEDHITKVKSVFEQEKIPIPKGFTAADVNRDAPKVYTDIFMLTYIHHMAKAGMLSYSGFLALSARKDIRKLYNKTLFVTADLYEQSSELQLNKGVFVRSPVIPYPKEIDMVDDKSYFKGLNPFAEKRALNAVEISHLHLNFFNNVVGLKLATSFAQMSPRKEVQKISLQGKDISEKHVKVFADKLISNNLQAPIDGDVSITNSTAEVFSDKLILFQLGMLTAAGSGNYATGAAASQRHDLILDYERLSIEVGQYAKDIANLMIELGYLEQPPGTMDKEKLAKSKEKQ
ncbi:MULTISPECIES: DUF3231 family protein [Cytobacillus]|uniref:DUF3231 family protein n=1 Tax=Cytobacillus stercorigallinarum TaxID=2762240 RepID=A0ABR8QVZ1_9BACI|nr:DUF3231 family protein [Cytobacillus stercorigallinarum]MBD7939427.1 DUF3231 family protein [Cytobacillus stercorigallinarum]